MVALEVVRGTWAKAYVRIVDILENTAVTVTGNRPSLKHARPIEFGHFNGRIAPYPNRVSHTRFSQ